MKKVLVIILALVMVISMTACSQNTPSNEVEKEVNNEMDQKDQVKEPLKVAVSVPPQEAFVKAIAGDLVDVVVMVPPGNSPANYQPTPKLMQEFQDADVYFSIGVPTEITNILPMVEDLDKTYHVVKLGDLVDAVYAPRFMGEHHHDEEGEEAHEHEEHEGEEAHEHEEHEGEEAHEHEEHEGEEGHSHEGRDPHIWLSPKRVQVMVDEMVKVLSELDPNNADTYQANGEKYSTELVKVDEEIKASIATMDHKTFIIFHPSMGYFADDYGLEMVAIEKDGKESGAQHLQGVIDYAKTHDIHVIFYQAEFDASQAKTIAQEIDGKVVELEVLSNDYINNLKKIAEALISAGK